MTEKNIRIVALDLDGTALNEKGEFSVRTRNAFRTVMEQGGHIVIATGRTFKSLPKQLFNIEGLEYVITSNGAYITRLADMERIYENIISQESVESIVELLREKWVSTEIFVDGKAYIDKTEYDEMLQKGSDYRDVGYVLNTRNPVENILSFMLENRENVENISLNFPVIEDKIAYKANLDRIPDVTVTSSFSHNYEIGGATTSKAEALRYLMRELGLDSNNLMACGDSPNDMEMIKLAAVGVVMENGSDSTKAIADYVTDSNAEDGVAKVIEKFVIKCK